MTHRFPPSDLNRLIDDHYRFDLAQSGAPELTWRDLSDFGVEERLENLVLGYGTSTGSEALRTAIARSIGGGVRSEHIIVTPGAGAALFLVTFTLAGPEDEVVTVVPNFPPTLDAVSASGATSKLLRLHFDDGYRMQLAKLEAALSRRTALVILVSPSSPSGTLVSQSNVADALALVRTIAPQARVLVDETYRRATYAETRRMPSTAAWDESVLTTESLSKCHGAPGLRIGWIVCREEAVRRRFAAAKVGTVIACGTVDEALATLLLDNEEAILARRARSLLQSLTVVEHWVAANPRYLEWVKPHAGAMCSIRLRGDWVEDKDATRVLEAFKKRNVSVAPGTLFGDETRVFRLGFGLLPPPQLSTALTLLSEALADFDAHGPKVTATRPR